MIWSKSTRTIYNDDIKVESYFKATTDIHRISDLLSGLQGLVL